MALLTMASTSEHWLTLMTCVVCEYTPDEAPVYLCNLGHTICLNCFKIMTKKGVPRCTICGSTKFKARTVSTDFLKKLKMKPGIGRPCRYELKPSETPSPSPSAINIKQQDETVTIEKLFNLPSEKIQEMFKQTTKEKLKKIRENTFNTAPYRCCKNEASIQKSMNLIQGNNYEWFLKRYQKPVTKEYTATSTHSRKPLHCPHHLCQKIIAVSSFNSHFTHEHSDLKRYQVSRGQELDVAFDPTLLECNTNYCLGLVTLYNSKEPEKRTDQAASKITRLFNQKIPLDTFWVMVSDSSEAKESNAYLHFWLFINNDNSYNCAMELVSEKDEMSFSIFCPVKSIYDSQNIQRDSLKINCLNVSHGGLESLLKYGPNPKFRMVIY